MKPFFIKCLCAIFIGILAGCFVYTVVLAQEDSDSLRSPDFAYGIASEIPINGDNIQDGYIVSGDRSQFQLSSTQYDLKLFGIVNGAPAVVLTIEDSFKRKYPVVSSGTVLVAVSNVNGEIKKDDYITSSSTSGVGMKATQPGYVVGRALEDYPETNSAVVGTIQVALNIQFHSDKISLGNGLDQVVGLSVAAASREPLRVFRYILAALVVALSIISGFAFFGRVASKGIDALGRNPLAARMIQFGIVINVFIAVSIIISGLVLAVIIVRM